jgi:hypothetical protein
MVGACTTIGTCMAALPAVSGVAQLAPVLAVLSLGVSAMATAPTTRVVDVAPWQLRSQVRQHARPPSRLVSSLRSAVGCRRCAVDQLDGSTKHDQWNFLTFQLVQKHDPASRERSPYLFDSSPRRRQPQLHRILSDNITVR